jgi:hypothetical protein
MKLKFLSIFLIFALLSVSTASASAAIKPTKDQVTTVLSGYDLQGQNNTYQLACEIGNYTAETYHWNCDIRKVTFKNHAPAYINVFYPEANNSKGYKAAYFWLGPQKKEVEYLDYGAFWYKDLGDLQSATCRIDNVCSWNTIKSFWGNSTAPANVTVVPVNNTLVHGTEVNNTPAPVVPVTTERNVKSVANNSVKVDNSGNKGMIYQQNAGGSIWNNIVIYAQNLYLTIAGK